MYCPINEPENNHCECRNRCCRLYNIALAFLASLILFTIGLILGAVFSGALLSALAVIIAAAAILLIIFLVTLITRGCCRKHLE